MRYLASLYSDRFKHPIFAAALTAAAVLFVSAALVQMAAPFDIPVWGREVPPFMAAFLGVFGTMALGIGALAYGVLFVAKFVSIVRDRMAPTAT